MENHSEISFSLSPGAILFFTIVITVCALAIYFHLNRLTLKKIFNRVRMRTLEANIKRKSAELENTPCTNSEAGNSGEAIIAWIGDSPITEKVSAIMAGTPEDEFGSLENEEYSRLFGEIGQLENKKRILKNEYKVMLQERNVKVKHDS